MREGSQRGAVPGVQAGMFPAVQSLNNMLEKLQMEKELEIAKREAMQVHLFFLPLLHSGEKGA